MWNVRIKAFWYTKKELLAVAGVMAVFRALYTAFGFSAGQ